MLTHLGQAFSFPIRVGEAFLRLLLLMLIESYSVGVEVCVCIFVAREHEVDARPERVCILINLLIFGIYAMISLTSFLDTIRLTYAVI